MPDGAQAPLQSVTFHVMKGVLYHQLDQNSFEQGFCPGFVSMPSTCYRGQESRHMTNVWASVPPTEMVEGLRSDTVRRVKGEGEEGAQRGLWLKTQLSLARASRLKDRKLESPLQGRAKPGPVAPTWWAGIHVGNAQHSGDKSSFQAVPNRCCQP